jgi:hypothetical protein
MERLKRENTPPPLKDCRHCGDKIRHPYYGEFGEHLCWDCFRDSCPKEAKKFYPEMFARDVAKGRVKDIENG